MPIPTSVVVPCLVESQNNCFKVLLHNPSNIKRTFKTNTLRILAENVWNELIILGKSKFKRMVSFQYHFTKKKMTCILDFIKQLSKQHCWWKPWWGYHYTWLFKTIARFGTTRYSLSSTYTRNNSKWRSRKEIKFTAKAIFN